MKSLIVKRSVVIAGHKTSISLETRSGRHSRRSRRFAGCRCQLSSRWLMWSASTPIYPLRFAFHPGLLSRPVRWAAAVRELPREEAVMYPQTPPEAPSAPARSAAFPARGCLGRAAAPVATRRKIGSA